MITQPAIAGFTPETGEWALVLANESETEAAYNEGRIEILELPDFRMFVEVTTDSGQITSVNAVFFDGYAVDDWRLCESAETVALVLYSSKDGELFEPLRGLRVTKCPKRGAITRVEVDVLARE